MKNIIFFCFLLFGFSIANAQVNFNLHDQFNGNYDFIAIGNTLNSSENGLGNPCTILTQSSATLNLAPSQTVEAAYLFWSGSGDGTGNLTIDLNGTPTTAEDVYQVTFNIFGDTYDFFGAFTDITAFVQATGNGIYTVSNFDLTSVIPNYCPIALNYGGWSILIVYEDSSLGANQVNIYKGFEFVNGNNTTATILLDNLNVVSTVGAKIGFLSWEGDDGIAINETLQLNGNLLSDLPLNPANNMFNGTNTYTNQNDLWNMDLDVLDISSIIQVGDTQATITITSGQDGVLLHNVATTISSELPDATVQVTDILDDEICDNRDLDVLATVFNINSTDLLPANVPVSLFVIDNTGMELYLDTVFTQNTLAIGESEDVIFSVTIPANVPLNTQLIVRVNDDGSGNNPIDEANLENNETIINLQLLESPAPPILDDLEECGLANQTIFDLNEATTQIDDTAFSISFFNTEIDSENNTNAITNPDSYTITGSQETIWVRIFDGNCFAVNSFSIQTLLPPTPIEPPVYQLCDFSDEQQGFTSFDLNSIIPQITGGNPNYAVEFFTTQADAQDLSIINGLVSPYTNENALTQTLFVRVTDVSNNCVAFTELELEVFLLPTITEDTLMPAIEQCDEDEDGIEEFDLTQNNTILLNGLDPTTHQIQFYTSLIDAQNDTNEILNASTFNSAGEFIYVRVTDTITTCFSFTSFQLIVNQIPQLQNGDVNSICDFNNDGVEQFFLPFIEDSIIADPTGYTFQYFETLPDAQNNINEINTPNSYQNIQTPNQTLFVLVSNDITGCTNIIDFEIEVLLPPQITEPPIFELCDFSDEQQGFTAFDLNSIIPQITGGNPNYAVEFFTTQEDAEDLTIINGVASPYVNETALAQTLFVRVVDINNNCLAFTELDLVINLLPVIADETQIPAIEECDDDEDGLADFNLSQNITAILNGLDPTLHQVQFYNSELDADNNTNEIVDTTNFTSSGQLIYVRVTETTTTCFSITNFQLIVNPIPPLQPGDTNFVCDLNNDGLAVFFLPFALNSIIDDPTGYTFQYFETLADAQNNSNEIADPNNFTNTQSPNQTLFVLATDQDTGCQNIQAIDIVVVPADFLPFDLTDLEVCAASLDGIGVQIDLTEQEQFIFGTTDPSIYTVSYHLSQPDAASGNNPIATPEAFNTLEYPQEIWVRIVNNVINCVEIGSFVYEILLAPVLVQPENIPPIEQCPNEENSPFQNWNLLDTIPFFYDTPALANISFHTSIFDAENNINPLPNNFQNTVNPQTIYVRAEAVSNGCVEYTSFTLVVNTIDETFLPDNLEVCDDDNDGFSNNFDLQTIIDNYAINFPQIDISFHLTFADAENKLNALSSPYANISQDIQTIFVNALDTDKGCQIIFDLVLIVVPVPLLSPITEPLVGCDDDFDGVLAFDLTEVEAEALGTLDPANLIITYHTSLLGAQTDTDLVPIPTAFQNTSSPQSIWIKVVDTSNNSLCFDIQEFQIIVEALPTITNPEPLEVCDDDTGGDLSDEIATFDLNDAIDEITLGNNELNVQFFETEDDLLNNNPINPIDAYVNTTNPQTLEILVTASTNGCSIRTTITLAVNPVPSLAPVLDPIEICDPDNDGFAEFDLQDIIEDILNNEPEVSITFHLTAADAELGVNPIDTSLPFGTSNNDTQTIYVRATNTGPNGNDGTECFDTRPLDLIVVPSPEIENLIDLSRCDDDTPNGFASFDLTINTPEAIGTQNDTQVTYHETQADAEAGTNAIAVPTNYTNITNPQTIYVRIEDLVTGCVDLFDSIGDPNNTFTLTVEALPVVFTPTALEICDDDYNQDPFPQTVFDLTVKEPEIVGQTVVPANLVFTYFESQDDLDNGVAITDPTAYTNTAQPQTIFIAVQDTDTQNSCTTTVLLTINVLPLPSPSTTDPDVLRLTGCDDDNDGVAIDPFDLTFSGNFIAGSENVLLSYYLNEDGAINEDPADLIADPTAYVNDPALNETDQNGLPTNVQIIYVRVDNNVAGNFCFVIVPFELVVLPNPELNPEGDPFAYTLCADDETSPENATLFSTQDITNNLWDLTDGASNIIIPLLDPNTTPVQNIDDFVVTYHTSEQDAEDGINAISPGYIASNGEILFIRVTNIDSQCFNTNNIAQVQIIIEPRPNIAADNPDELVVCADDFQQGIATIDLTLYDDLINPGAPNNTQVVYYEGQTNYDNGVFITDPVNYTTIQTPTTIIAEVINTLTGCESSRTLVFDIIVNPIFGDISGFDGVILCVDASGNAIFNEISPPVIDTGLSEAEFSFEWALDGVPLPDTTPSITPTLPGLYTVVVTHLLTGCQANSSANVIPNQAINFNVDVVTTAFSSTHAAEVNTITGNGDFEFRIDDGPWIQLQPGQTTLLFTNLTPGMHTITGRDQGGCGEVSIEFMFIDYPPFFTPNQDGFNDTWNISTLSGDEQATVYIFDRYGKLLKQISPRGEGWDGTYNGKAMPSQDYWFRVEFIEPTTGAKSEFKAHFTLKR